ncbi:hypothetical protein EDC27_2681 [Desulfosoma caldarium]|uniref:Uncharacterized protein n=1 Tax=Desulfosoma caldarium TaxID=610254 RepID=A0A3N1UQG7_9BACT|nr:hypothetical protein EDC27_2681 [Desulfosoma caldarium]
MRPFSLSHTMREDARAPRKNTFGEPFRKSSFLLTLVQTLC